MGTFIKTDRRGRINLAKIVDAVYKGYTAQEGAGGVVTLTPVTRAARPAPAEQAPPVRAERPGELGVTGPGWYVPSRLPDGRIHWAKDHEEPDVR